MRVQHLGWMSRSGRSQGQGEHSRSLCQALCLFNCLFLLLFNFTATTSWKTFWLNLSQNFVVCWKNVDSSDRIMWRIIGWQGGRGGAMAESREGVLGTCKPPSPIPRPISFIFMQFSAEILLNSRFSPQTQRLTARPYLGNPGSATGGWVVIWEAPHTVLKVGFDMTTCLLIFP